MNPATTSTSGPSHTSVFRLASVGILKVTVVVLGNFTSDATSFWGVLVELSDAAGAEGTIKGIGGMLFREIFEVSFFSLLNKL